MIMKSKRGNNFCLYRLQTNLCNTLFMLVLDYDFYGNLVSTVINIRWLESG